MHQTDSDEYEQTSHHMSHGDTAEYISDLAAQLATLAEANQLHPAAHLLRYAALEAARTSDE
jgi:hypothetical protein